MPNQEKPKRAKNSPENEVGKIRGKIYTGVFDQITKAEEQGFYLEAITLYESLITDRLESALSMVTGFEYPFKNLGPLITEVRSKMPNSELRTLVDNRLDQWRMNRNESQHQMAKLAEGQEKELEVEYQKCAAYCVEGKAIFRQLDKLVVKIKSETKKSQKS